MSDEKALSVHATTDLAAVEKELEDLNREREEAKARGAYIKIEEGRHILRFLPPRQGKKSPFLKTWMHFIKNPGRPTDKGRPVVCPNKTRDARCLACEKVAQLRRSDSPVDQEIAKDMTSKRQILANIVDMDHQDKGVQVYQFGVTIYEGLLKLMDKKNPAGVGDFTDPDNGFNMVIERTGKEREDTRYRVDPARVSSALLDRAWLKQLHDLDALLKETSDDRIAAILEGRDNEFPPSDSTPEYRGPNAADDIRR